MADFPAPDSRPSEPFSRRANAALQRWVWDRRAGTWDHHGSSGLEGVVEAVLAAAGAAPGTVAVDLGCGSGALTLPLVARGASVTGVDVSPTMIEMLEKRVSDEGLGPVTTLVSPIEQLRWEAASIDLVVSNYALHHLADRDKQAVVAAAAGWLRPGGRLVVGDMMFGRGSTARDREIIRSKVALLVRRGPGGWWRLAKNVVRFGARLQERPVGVDTWVGWFEEAGLVDVSATPVVAEAAVVAGSKAADPRDPVSS